MTTTVSGSVGTSAGTTPASGTAGRRPAQRPRAGASASVSVAIDWRVGRLGNAAKFSIEPSIGPAGTVVSIYGTFRPAFSGGAVMCTFSGAQPISPFFVSMRRMVVVIPNGAKSGLATCKVGAEVLWSGRFIVTANQPEIKPNDEEQGVLAVVYKLPQGTNKLPNFSQLEPAGTFVSSAIYAGVRDFKRGFPGAEIDGNLVREWYGVRFVGQVNATREADYSFKLLNSDGAKLYIDDKVVIDNDGVHGPTEKEGTVRLTQGKHRIVVEFFKTTGTELALQVWWKRGSNPYSGIGRNSLSRYSLEYDCSQNPVTSACCKAATPACQMCAQRQKAVLDGWRRQCVRN